MPGEFRDYLHQLPLGVEGKSRSDAEMKELVAGFAANPSIEQAGAVLKDGISLTEALQMVEDISDSDMDVSDLLPSP